MEPRDERWLTEHSAGVDGDVSELSDAPAPNWRAGEDVLDGPVPRHPARGTVPRSPFLRRRDLIALGVIVVVALAGVVVVWAKSDVRATASQTGPANVTAPAAPTSFPPSLAEAWSAPSAATPVPVVAGPTVVTGDSGQVLGRDPLTGAVRWRYARDLPLCEVTSAWSKVLAVYHKARNCSEVTALDATTGARGAQRNGDAELGTRLLFDGTYVATTGRSLIDVWRSDLVQTTEYGTVPAVVNPNRQPRTGCTYSSTAQNAGKVAVIEHCPGDQGDRLTVFKATSKDADTPEFSFSSVLPYSGAEVLAVNDTKVVVAFRAPQQLVVFNGDSGSQVAQYPLTLPATDLAANPAGLVATTSTSATSVYWFTGSRTIALSSTDFHPQWTVPDTLGSGTVFAGRTLIPVPDGITVLDQATGAKVGTIGVDRHGYRGLVQMSTLGPVVLEQRGGTLVAMH